MRITHKLSTFKLSLLLTGVILGTVCLIIVILALYSHKTTVAVVHNSQYATNPYRITYPKQFTKATSTDANDPVTTYFYTDTGASYYFHVSPPGDQNIEFTTHIDAVTTKNTVYGTVHFQEKTWYVQGKPVLIHATTMNSDPYNNYDFSIELPQDNPQKYVELFHTTLASIVLRKK